MAKRFKKDTPVYFDYKDVKTLGRYIDIYGRIKQVGKTGLSAKQQRQLAIAIKRARHLALLPFIAQGQTMAYQPTDLKKGVVISLDGKPFRVVEYSQKVMGRGGSIVNVRVKNLIDGSVLTKTFKGQDKIEPAEVTNQTAQYLYNDGANFYFMDPTTFEQFQISSDIAEGTDSYLKEGDNVTLQLYNGSVINVELPKNVFLEVTYTENVVKGDTTSSVLKEAKLETGISVKVPAFIKTGDIISVDTSTGEYRERKKGQGMNKQRLDIALTQRGLTSSRSQAESWIKLGKVTVDGKTVIKPGFFVGGKNDIELVAEEKYVSRAGLKLASVAELLKLNFKDKIVLDVGSSTGGFTDYALQHGAKKVYAVDVGTEQLHPSLRNDPRIELHEKTDIRDFKVVESLDLVLIDVSFISLREILPYIHDNLTDKDTQVVAMLKPQFEAGQEMVSKGVIKNEKIRRQILKDFEVWAKKLFVIIDKRDSDVAGARGNQERFYLLKPIH